MTFKIEVRRLAEAELAEAAAWYDLRLPGLGNEFLEQFRAQMKLVGESPNRWPFYIRDIRRYVMTRFPFVAYYEVREDTVRVLRVVHTSKNPEPVRTLFV